MPNRGVRLDECGLSMIEVLVAATVTLVLMSGSYSMLTDSQQSFSQQTERLDAQEAGRLAIDLLGSTAWQAGYNPLGVHFAPLPDVDATRVRFLADLDGDGTVGADPDGDEDVTFVFLDKDGDGLFELARGVDRNGDGDFVDTSESFVVLASDLVRIDHDGDGFAEPMLAYTPAGRDHEGTLTIAFGARAESRRSASTVLPFYDVIPLRNARGWQAVADSCPAGFSL